MGRRPKGPKTTVYGTLALPRGFGPTEPTPEIGAHLERLLLEGYPLGLALAEVGVSDSVFARWSREGHKGVEPYLTLIGKLAMAEAKGRGAMVSRSAKNAITAQKMLAVTSPGAFSTKAADRAAEEVKQKVAPKERNVVETPVVMSEDEWAKLFNRNKPPAAG